MQDVPERSVSETRELSTAILSHLRSGKLPQMVDWLDPVMLAQIGMRTIVSGTLGQYADQRLMQAATDKADEAALIARYNFADGPDAIPPDAVWVDYISDLGDGFEATFAMASLMAPDSLNVKGASAPLPAGKILIMGGDQAYPQSSAQEYKDRLIDPYNWAYPLGEQERPERKLFALPGNHDWYDGLGAFDSLFCTVRNLIAKGKGNRIGGWECAQHRSYFAIRLPHDWWIWGADIQLDGVFDKAQRDYFHIMSEQALAGHKIVICLAEPSWLHERYENLLDIAYLARKHEAKVYAVLAGDLHHYSRFATPLKEAGVTPLNVQFITCGGGGAFAHATHGLKSEVTLTWPEVKAEQTRSRAAARAKAAPAEKERRPDAPPSGGPDFGRMGEKALAALSAPLAPGAMGFTDRLTGASIQTARAEKSKYKLRPARIYPSRTTSRLLSLKNLWLPFHNRRFALFVGLVYFMFAWVFLSTDNALHPAFQKTWVMEEESVKQLLASRKAEEKLLKSRMDELKQAQAPSAADIAFVQGQLDAAKASVLALEKFYHALDVRNGIVAPDHSGERLPDPIAALRQGPEFMSYQYSFLETIRAILDPRRTFNAAQSNPAYFFMLLALLSGLVHYTDIRAGAWGGLGSIAKLAVGTAHALAHIVALLVVCAITLCTTYYILVFPSDYAAARVAWPGWLTSTIDFIWRTVLGPLPEAAAFLLYSLLFVLLGGLIGAFIFGLYWAIMSSVFARHADDAFGALGLRHYKHFLRMHFEPGRLTIYPIAIDAVPGRKDWRAPGPSDPQQSNKPLIVPMTPLNPYLLEVPIVIQA